MVSKQMFLDKKPRTVACGLRIGMAPILDALLPRWIAALKRLEAGNGIVHLPEKEGKTYQSHRSERVELVREVRGAHHTSKHASHKGGGLRDRTG